MQAILLTTCLLILAAMLASLAWLSSVRARADGETVAVENAEQS
jgi:hypothetical protein